MRYSKDWFEILREAKRYEICMTDKDINIYLKTKSCRYCQRSFSADIVKVRHHNSLLESNNFIAAICNHCNLKMKNMFPLLNVLVHNLSYDMTLILKEASSIYNFSIHKMSGAKYYYGRVKYLKFIDSLNMINGSLDKLASEHIKAKAPLNITNTLLSSLSEKAKTLLLQTGKQILPYEYISSFTILNKEEIPPKWAFNSKLKNSSISDTDYNHMIEVWKASNCKTLADYTRIYLKLDVGLLADIYLCWRDALYSIFGLDCSFFLTLSSLSMEAFYYQTKIKLPCLSNNEVYQLIKQNIRGGFCSVVQRLAIANNKSINPQFNDETDTSNYIVYIDFNSLYPTVMSSFKLPYNFIHELNPNELEHISNNISSIDCQGEYGYFILCDTKPIKDEIAIKTDSFPLALNHLNITSDLISPHSRNLLQSSGVRLGKNNKKLVASHLGMSDYFVYLPLLQYLISLGMEVMNVKKVYKFKQGTFLKTFIDNNVRLRSIETNTIRKNALKLCSNGIFGRTLLNPENYATRVSIANNETSLLRNVSQPTYRKVDQISDTRYLITHNKKSIIADSPLYIGCAILDLAKLKMYTYYYDTLVKNYGERVKLLYMDTDSFIISIETSDILKELAGPLKNSIDFSNFPVEHNLYNEQDKGKLGKLKLETGINPILEFVGVKPKAYSYKTTVAENNTLKGVPKHVRETIMHETYKSCINNCKSVSCELYNLLPVKGQMSMIKQKKTALSAYEDKRYYISATESYAYGHPKVKQHQIENGKRGISFDYEVNNVNNHKEPDNGDFVIINRKRKNSEIIVASDNDTSSDEDNENEYEFNRMNQKVKKKK